MKKKETSHEERLKQIESELKVIKKCVDAKRFHDGLKGNGFEIVNAKLNFSDAINLCLTLDSSIKDYETVLIYRQKLRNEKNNIKKRDSKTYVTGCWLSKKLALKWKKKLALISDNYTTAFNQHVENL